MIQTATKLSSLPRPRKLAKGYQMAREAIIRAVNSYELHGVPYYQLAVAFVDEPDSLREVRISRDAKL